MVQNRCPRLNHVISCHVRLTPNAAPVLNPPLVALSIDQVQHDKHASSLDAVSQALRPRSLRNTSSSVANPNCVRALSLMPPYSPLASPLEGHGLSREVSAVDGLWSGAGRQGLRCLRCRNGSMTVLDLRGCFLFSLALSCLAQGTTTRRLSLWLCQSASPCQSIYPNRSKCAYH